MLDFSGKKRLPMLRQAEAAECGLACLAMVAGFYGYKIDLVTLRSRHAFSTRGLTLEALLPLASKMQLGSRAVRLDLGSLADLHLPAILHWDMNHFVVLKSVNQKSVIIHDPAKGICRLSIDQVSEHFTGVAVELFPTKEFVRVEDVKKMPLTDLWGNLSGVKRGIIQTLILSVILQVLVLLSPFYLQLVVDEALLKFDSQLLLTLALGFGFVALLHQLTSMMRSWTILYLGNLISYQMVANVFSHLMRLPVTYFENRHIGDIISRVRSTKPIQTALSQSLVSVVIDGLMAVVTAIVIFSYSLVLGAVVLISVFLMILTTVLYYPSLRKFQEEAILADAEKDSHEIESIRSSTSIKLFNAQNSRMLAWRNLFAKSINANVIYGKHDIFNATLQELLASLQTVIVVFVGAGLILNDTYSFTIGMLFAFMAYRQSFTQSILALLEKYVEFKLLSLHLERVSDIVFTETENSQYSSEVSTDSLKGQIGIQVENLWFRYSENESWVLKNISFEIQKGEFVSITGPSGGGKTTLLKLLLGLYEPTQGNILINGMPIGSIPLESWRDRIGVVMQEDQLLSGNLAQNISFFSHSIDMVKVKEVARKAFVNKEIEDMPMNYLSLVGDTGSSLSGGQKQRVILARALYKNPSLLVLDEGTANLDVNTEEKIVQAIKELEDCTRVVIAHRPSFLNNSNRVITIRNGSIET